jgi:hypothetical protein
MGWISNCKTFRSERMKPHFTNTNNPIDFPKSENKMNERIRQLAEQAGYLPDMFGIGHWDMPECKKFAELIVQECLDIVNRKEYSYHEADPLWETAQLIKEHFGVEDHMGWVCPKCGIDRSRDVCPKGHTAAMTGDCPMIATAQSGVE